MQKQKGSDTLRQHRYESGEGDKASETQQPLFLNQFLCTVGLGLFIYMAYATIYGPYKTTIVHLAIFAGAMLFYCFLGSRSFR